MVVDWEQETGLLMTSGDVRIIRIWDTDREMKVQVRSTHGPPGALPRCCLHTGELLGCAVSSEHTALRPQQLLSEVAVLQRAGRLVSKLPRR